MIKKLGLGLIGIIVIFLGYVSTRDGHFRYERSAVINAPASKIFPYISNLKKGGEWSPYEKKDANMKKTYVGADGHVGSILEFEGNNETGSGKLEILTMVPNQAVQLKLTMSEPFEAENLIEYTLTPEGKGTKFSWAMSGEGGFIGKLMGVLIDCEAMVTKDFEVGIQNLKDLVESKKS